MSPNQLGTALRDLVDGVEDDAVVPAPADLWRDGSRRRVRTRAVAGLAAASVAAMVALLAWPAGEPRSSVPAVTVDDRGNARLTSYPAAIAKPPFLDESDRPGVTAAVVTRFDDRADLYAVSPGGAVTRLVLPQLTPGTPLPSISPDGRWLARGTVLNDLVTGQTLSWDSPRGDLSETGLPTDDPAWWAPDSRRAFVDAMNQGVPASGGLVLGTDGSVVEAPLVDGGRVPTIAGWLDDDTLLALLGDGETLSLRTWTVGATAWTPTGGTIAWGPAAASGLLRASVSPDGRRVLLSRPTEEDGAAAGTEAMMFDATTGAQLGMPLTDGTLRADAWVEGSFLGWEGWGCAPAWREGLPVSTDGGVRFAPPPTDRGHLTTVSSRFGGGACASFAGDELRGRPQTDQLAMWQERTFSYGLPALVILAVIAALVIRRRPRRRPRLSDLPVMLWATRT